MSHFVDIVCGRECGQSVLRGAHVYAPGVLGISLGMLKSDRMVSIMSEISVDEKTKKGSKLISPSKDFLLVGNGLIKMDHTEIFHTVKKGMTVCVTEPVFATLSMDDLSCEFYPQNLPSVIVTHLLNPQPGERVCDMACAPGGKTTHICQLMKNKGSVVAWDRSKSKIKLVHKLKQELNLDILTVQTMNSTEALKKGYKEGEFDRVLLDAPCSGFGLIPVFALPQTLDTIKENASYQKRMLKEAYGLCKVGGTIVFSVCSSCPLEGEENVKWFLETYKDCHLDTPPDHFFKYASFGVEKILGSEHKKVLRFDPVVNHGSIGFFCAKFQKTKREQ